MSSRTQDLCLLGFPQGASEGALPSRDEIKRAFRRQALQCHPDKNRHDPVGAAESFRRLAAAYQRLASAQHYSATKQAWEDLDVCEDVLTEEFFAEAFAQDIPPFELMYIQERMASARQQSRPSSDPSGSPADASSTAADADAGADDAEAQPRVCVWAEDPASVDASMDAMWCRIHKLLSKRRRREERRAAAQAGGGEGKETTSSWSQPHRRRYKGSREDKRMLFWDFLSDLVRQDENSYCYVQETPDDGSTASPGSWALCLTEPTAANGCGQGPAQAMPDSQLQLHPAAQHSQLGHAGVEFLPVACTTEQQQQQQQQHQQQPPRLALGARLRRRTNWRFYWTWAKRLLLIRVLLYMLPS